jgi:anti-sigma B factor antagonist
MVDSSIDQGSAAWDQASTRPSVETDASGWAVVTLRGEQDVYEAKRSRAALNDGLAASWGRVVVDLSEVTFSDSSLLGALAGAVRTARRHNSVVKVVVSDDRLAQKLKVTGLSQVVRIFPTLPDALEGRS